MVSTILRACLLFFLMVLHHIQVISTVATQLEGKLISCKEEGAVLNLKITANNPHIKCYCKGGIVKCNREKECPSNEGCHYIQTIPDSQCKDTCLGCLFNNRTLISGQSVQDEINPCITIQCNAGILTRSKDVCFTPCRNPVKLPDLCCPVCQGCFYRGRHYINGIKFIDHKDPCVKCQCKDGNIECRKKACPELNCPVKYLKEPAFGKCCPTCEGKRKLQKLSNRCMYHPNNQVYPDNTLVPTDSCKTCSCHGNTVVCEKMTCPRLKCKSKDVIPTQLGQCCPTCLPQKKKCKIANKKIKHGRTWFRDMCTECLCNDGVTHCWKEDCSSVIENCPKQTHELQYNKGKCCPQCVELSATCVVFGDPHYRTFDGLLYTFQGTCMYTLVQQCGSRHRTFSIRVQNSAWADKPQYAYTDSVLISTSHLKVELKQKLKVHVNSYSIELPYIKLGHMSIIQRGYNLIVTTSLGVTVIWDGLSYLEVTVPQRYKGQMCGLCGNYNGISTDDFTGRHKIKYSNAIDFANSWQRSPSTCSIYSYNKIPVKTCSLTDKETLSWIYNKCKELQDYILQSQCDMIDDIKLDYYQCVDQLCSCDLPLNCYCQSAKSLVKACQPAHLGLATLKDIVLSCI